MCKNVAFPREKSETDIFVCDLKAYVPINVQKRFWKG